MSKEFISLPPKPGSKRIGQGVLPFAVEKQGDFGGIGMGILKDGTPFPGEAWNAAYAPDERRCRWPECQCYAPQGPQSCIRQSTALRSLTEAKP